MSSFKSNENIQKKEDGLYYVVSANKASLKWRGDNLDISDVILIIYSNTKITHISHLVFLF